MLLFLSLPWGPGSSARRHETRCHLSGPRWPQSEPRPRTGGAAFLTSSRETSVCAASSQALGAWGPLSGAGEPRWGLWGLQPRPSHPLSNLTYLLACKERHILVRHVVRLEVRRLLVVEAGLPFGSQHCSITWAAETEPNLGLEKVVLRLVHPPPTASLTAPPSSAPLSTWSPQLTLDSRDQE